MTSRLTQGYDREKQPAPQSPEAAIRRHRMLERLTLKNFTVFKDAEIAFVPGINVFLGANATGKTHAMKLAYSLLRSASELQVKHPAGQRGLDSLGDEVARKLTAVFRPDKASFGRLVRRNESSLAAKIALFLASGSISCDISGGDVPVFMLEASGPADRPEVSFLPSQFRCLFLPAREVLSIYPGFLAAYLDRELAFDETYYDLCLALSASRLRGRRAEEAAAIWKPLSQRLNAVVKLQQDSFFLHTQDEGLVEAHLVAEGHRKLATLMHLIANGSLAKGNVLFWDEPEANLNPRLTKVVADFLLQLARNGIQVVLATHDYLLTNELSLHAEYETEATRGARMRFFSFTRGEDRSVSVQAGETLADLADNPIMEEFQALYDRERRLFLAREEEPARLED